MQATEDDKTVTLQSPWTGTDAGLAALGIQFRCNGSLSWPASTTPACVLFGNKKRGRGEASQVLVTWLSIGCPEYASRLLRLLTRFDEWRDTADK